MKQEVRAVRKDFADLGEQGKKTAADFGGIETAISNVAKSRGQITQLTSTLENVNARIDVQKKKLTELKQSYETTFNEARKTKLHEQILNTEASIIRLTATSDQTAQRIWALSDKTAKEILQIEDAINQVGQQSTQIDKVNDALKETDDEARKAAGGIETIQTGLVALGANVALNKMVGVMKTLTGETLELQNSVTGLGEVANSLGHNVDDVTEAAQQLEARGFMTLKESAEALKTTLSTGYGLQESIDLIIALGDAAAYNRESHFEWGEAVVRATQGIKMQNSSLTDSAGITTNLSVMYDRYAKSIGTTAGKLTESQKAQAAYNGMMQEAALFAGNAERALEGYTGTQTSFNKTIAEARAELGESFMPLLEEVMNRLQPLIVDFGKWAAENREVVAGTAAAGVAVTGLVAILTSLVTVLGAVRAAMVALNVSMGPIGWAIAGIGAIAAGVLAYSTASDLASESILKFAQNQEELNAKLAESPLDRSTSEVQALQSDIDTLNGILAERNALMEEYTRREKEAESGRGTIQNTHEMFELADAIKAVDKELRSMDYSTVEEAENAIEKMNSALQESVPALVEIERAELRDVAAKVQKIDTINALSREYSDLAGKTKLNEEQQAQLSRVVQQLTKEYPGLVSELDEHGRWIIKNTDYLSELIQTERDSIADTVAASRGRLNAWRIETEEKLKLAQKQLNALAAISESQKPKTLTLPQVPNPFGIPMGLHPSMQQSAEEIQRMTQQVQKEKNEYQLLINEIDKDLAAITEGVWDRFTYQRPDYDSASADKDKKKKGKKEPKGKKEKTAEQLAQEAYRASLQWIEKQKLLNKMSEAEELKRLGELAERYKKYDDIWIDAESRRQRLEDQMAADKKKRDEEAKKKTEQAAKERYEASTQWIEAEVRRMTEKGASEQAITEFQLEAWTRVRNRYEKDTDFYKNADKVMYQQRMNLRKLDEQAAKQAFDASAQWIEMETRRMTELGATEREITEMQLDAWTRVRARYDKDSDHYKRADKAMYDARMSLRKDDERLAKDLAQEQEKRSKESTKAVLDNIDKQRKAELDALDERRKATQKFYDDQLKAMDEAERGKDRQEIIEEAEKYRLATSEKGRKRFEELQEQLRKMDLDDQKRALQDERDQKLDALDQQKRDMDTWYEDLKTAIDDFNGDFRDIYLLTEDVRFQAFVETNGKIKQEMEAFQKEMEAITTKTAPAPNALDPYKQSLVYQMQANSRNWHNADAAGKSSLAADNEKLGNLVGATYDPGSGKWMLNGVPLYHTGGRAGEFNFRMPDMLMPDEILGILKRSENVLTDKQIGSLIGAVQGGGQTIIERQVIMEMHDTVIEDALDLQSLQRQASGHAEQLRKQLAGGGGVG